MPAQKIKIGTNVHVYPMSTNLVGSLVNNRVNFMAAGWVTRANLRPPMLAVGLNKASYTTQGIFENKSFSVNLPSIDMIEAADYCGIVSGRKVDKSNIFEVFYGELKTAPMITECPLCLECRLANVVELPSNNLFIGEIVAAYTEEKYVTDGKPDIRKMKPLLLTVPDNSYWTMGQYVGRAWSIGKAFSQRKSKT